MELSEKNIQLEQLYPIVALGIDLMIIKKKFNYANVVQPFLLRERESKLLCFWAWDQVLIFMLSNLIPLRYPVVVIPSRDQALILKFKNVHIRYRDQMFKINNVCTKVQISVQLSLGGLPSSNYSVIFCFVLFSIKTSWNQFCNNAKYFLNLYFHFKVSLNPKKDWFMPEIRELRRSIIS